MKDARLPNESALPFITAGNATFTLRSVRTGARFTYRVRKAKEDPTGRYSNENTFFVKALDGQEYRYLGMIKGGQFTLTRASAKPADDLAVKAFAWTFQRLAVSADPKEVEIWHAGTCGRCGIELTVPESIAAGYGPECIKKIRRQEAA